MTDFAPLPVACSIADRLVEEAIWHEGRAVWLGDVTKRVDDDWHVVRMSVDGDLYGGTAGIGLFFTRLWRVTQRETYREAAVGALRHAAEWHRRVRPDGSWYSGSAGVACALAEGARTFGDDELRAQAVEIGLDTLDALPDSENDLIVGRAGTLLGLLWLDAELELPQLAEGARRLADGLVTESVRTSWGGAAWTSDVGADEPPLCGLAHGASGAALALNEAGLAFGSPEWIATGEAATVYESAWYQRDVGNWPDLRDVTRFTLAKGDAPAYPMFWCHGAPGIGLVRLRLFESTGHARYAAEAGAAIVAVQRHVTEIIGVGHPVDLSQCHGLAGSVELLLEGARIFRQPRLREMAGEVASFAATVGGDGSFWPCGVPKGGENPSLMLGLAGIGMMFLRFADPVVPPVGILYTRPVRKNRLIVQFRKDIDHERLPTLVAELSNVLPAARVERFSRRGRVILRLPPEASAAAAADRVNTLEHVEYAEPDVVDHATESDGGESSQA